MAENTSYSPIAHRLRAAGGSTGPVIGTPTQSISSECASPAALGGSGPGLPRTRTSQLAQALRVRSTSQSSDEVISGGGGGEDSPTPSLSPNSNDVTSLRAGAEAKADFYAVDVGSLEFTQADHGREGRVDKSKDETPTS